MVGDRGMITGTRIADLRKCEGMGWIGALKAPAIARLAADEGPLQMSLFDTHSFAEIAHPDYPGERLICCRNPFLAAERARKREDLLAATEKDLDKIRAAAGAGRLSGAAGIGERVGKVIDKHKVGKHFLREITSTSLAYRRDKLPVRGYQDLLSPLAPLARQTVSFAGQKIDKLTTPTPVQRRAFELLGAPVPLTLQ